MEVRLALESGPTAAPLARDELRLRLGDRLSADSLTSLLLIVSELVTNSVRHAPGEPIEVRITVNDDGSVRGEVEDQGAGDIEIRELTHGGTSGGFGLRIVEALTDQWGVYEDSTNVWFEMSSPPPAEPSSRSTDAYRSASFVKACPRSRRVDSLHGRQTRGTHRGKRSPL
jgi:anti-sigma regulatory factor (Ser/Thr protein kinase)